LRLPVPAFRKAVQILYWLQNYWVSWTNKVWTTVPSLGVFSYRFCFVFLCSFFFSRILLCEATRIVMAQSLNLLGINPLDRIWDRCSKFQVEIPLQPKQKHSYRLEGLKEIGLWSSST
jgi:hypothetical protein